MFDSEIETILQNAGVANYLGTFAIDEIPTHIPSDCSMVINLNTSSQNGSHWVCVVNKESSQYCEYFDSFGIAPAKQIKAMCKSSNKECIMSTNEIQNYESIMCGYFCCYYIIKRCVYNISPYDIIYSFTNNSSTQNDKIVYDFLKQYF